VSDAPKYWFNIRTKQVEHGLKSSSEDRIGPFDSAASEAANAEAIVRGSCPGLGRARKTRGLVLEGLVFTRKTR
jgi:hypothetical protein